MVHRPDDATCIIDLGANRSVRAIAKNTMSPLYWIALIVSAGLLGYLLYALLRAEKF